MHHQRILILDFGSQVTQLIARRVREARVYCEIHPSDVSAEFIRQFAPAGVILSGSHMELVPEVVDRLRAEGVDAPVIVGGIIPEEDRTRLRDRGVAAVYTPKDFDIGRIMREVAQLAATHRGS